jgi:hypothetical protein
VNGRQWWWRLVVVAGVLAAGGQALAQVPAGPGAASPDARGGQRYQLAVMEGILEAAVQQGARVVSRQWRAVSPETLFISGNARARGFLLDNYGVFFDVQVPALRQSVTWTWRQLDRDFGGTSVALQTLKDHLKTVTDPAVKRDIDQAIRRLELQMGPTNKVPDESGVQGQVQGGSTPVRNGPAQVQLPPAAGAAGSVVLPMDPETAYTNEVKSALIDAMLDHSHALTIGPDEWLTVAAHDDDMARRLGATEPYEAVTMLFRVKGADLQAFRGGRLTRAEARQRIEIKEY